MSSSPRARAGGNSSSCTPGTSGEPGPPLGASTAPGPISDGPPEPAPSSSSAAASAAAAAAATACPAAVCEENAQQFSTPLGQGEWPSQPAAAAEAAGRSVAESDKSAHRTDVGPSTKLLRPDDDSVGSAGRDAALDCRQAAGSAGGGGRERPSSSAAAAESEELGGQSTRGERASRDEAAAAADVTAAPLPLSAAAHAQVLASGVARPVETSSSHLPPPSTSTGEAASATRCNQEVHDAGTASTSAASAADGFVARLLSDGSGAADALDSALASLGKALQCRFEASVRQLECVAECNRLVLERCQAHSSAIEGMRVFAQDLILKMERVIGQIGNLHAVESQLAFLEGAMDELEAGTAQLESFLGIPRTPKTPKTPRRMFGGERRSGGQQRDA